MELKIYWTDFSKRELKKIFNYYKEKANLNVAKNLVLGITKETVKLKKQPGIGQEEELNEKFVPPHHMDRVIYQIKG